MKSLAAAGLLSLAVLTPVKAADVSPACLAAVQAEIDVTPEIAAIKTALMVGSFQLHGPGGEQVLAALQKRLTRLGTLMGHAYEKAVATPACAGQVSAEEIATTLRTIQDAWKKTLKLDR